MKRGEQMTRQELYKQADGYKAQQVASKWRARMETKESQTLAYREMYTLAKEKDLQITEALLKKFHEFVLEEKGLKEEVGTYRKESIEATRTGHIPPAPEELERLIGHFISQMQISRQMFHPIEFAAICHKRILELCPFKEGNEEVAMLIMNLILAHHGYAVLPNFEGQEAEYLKTLKAAQHPSSLDIDGFIYFIAQCVVKKQEEQEKELKNIN